MIWNQWYVILESREVKPGKPVGVKRMGENLVLWRDEEGKVACILDQCVHRGAALSLGKVVDQHIQCPFHGLEFDASGQCTYIPANGRSVRVPKVFRTRAYPTHEEHGFIWIWWGEARETLPPVRFFDAIDEDFPYMTIVDHWDTHYSRAIENQLDVIHLPFIHHNSIGRGDRRVVDGPLAEWGCEAEVDECDLLHVWVYNRVEDGTPARKPDQLPRPTRRPFLQFRFPNVWHNWISDDMRVTAAFVPVDDEQTLMYLRYYQRTLRIPILKEIFLWIGKIGSLYIARQDRRVVNTQRPKRSYNRMGETLLTGDLPITLYRRHREALIKKAKNTPPPGV
jgi:phenylpropionate dioxygenase-like ring-hydroxylating dioxygenase large terminal subunit